MITIIEVTPDEDVRYEMNGAIYDRIWIGLQMRWFKTVKEAVSKLPEDMRQHVTVKVIPKQSPVTRVLSDDILYNEMLAIKSE